MSSKSDAAQRVAEAADAWLQEPTRPSLYKAMIAAVREWRRHERHSPSSVVEPADPVLAVRQDVIRLPALASAAKMHRDAEFLRAKRARWREPHVERIQSLVDEIRAERGTVNVPYVDPDSGGVRAKVLFVLESPAGPAAMGSEMLSPDNDDETAANMWRLYQQSGLPRSVGLHWNAVPWYVGTAKRNGAVSPADVSDGVQWLGRLLDLLPELQLVITMGKPAERSFRVYRDRAEASEVRWLAVAHPSPRVRNGHPRLWPAIEDAFAQAAVIA